MSNLVTNACKALVIPPSPKFVVMALADGSNDAGVVFERIGIRAVCTWTCLSRDSVLRAFKWLEERGLLRITRSEGRRNQLTLDLAAIAALNQSHGATGDQSHHATGSTSRTVRPVAPCDWTSSTVRPVPVAPCDPITPIHLQEEEKESREQRSAPKRRIPDDWQPDATLKAWALEQRPELDLSGTVDNFRDYHLAKGEARASWDASFRTWIRNENKFGARGKRPAGRQVEFSADYYAGASRDGELTT